MKQYQLIYIQLKDYKFCETYTNNLSVAQDMFDYYIDFSKKTKQSYVVSLLDVIANKTISEVKAIV